MKRALYFSPHNFFEKKSGAHHGSYQIAQVLRAAGYQIDQYALKNFESSWSDMKMVESDLIHNIHFYDMKRILRRTKQNSRRLLDLTDSSMKKDFKQLVEKNQYDLVIFDYVFWSNLLNQDFSYSFHKLLIVHDMLSVQQIDHFGGTETFEHLLTDELRRIRMFDGGFATSHVEKAFLEMSLPNLKLCYLPLTSGDPRTRPSATAFSNRKTDVLFVGFNNIHNVRAMKWLIDEVSPHLERSLRITIVGKVNEVLGTVDNARIEQLNFVDDLDSLYEDTKITVCPMFSGSGTKVKVIESLGRGIPVVCNERSLFGFRDQQNTGCSIAEEPLGFAKALNELCRDEKRWVSQQKLALNYYRDEFSSKMLLDRGVKFLEAMAASPSIERPKRSWFGW